jgi:hypothetical protein
MSLFPEENILTKEIESRRFFADGLKSEEDKKLFLEMLEKCEKYSSNKRQGKTISNRTFDYGSSVGAAQNDKLVRK